MLSLSNRSRILEILQSFACFSLDIEFSEKLNEKSVLEAYKDFNTLFEDHFYKKASIGASKIKEEKLNMAREYELFLATLENLRQLFLVNSLGSIEEGFEYNSRQVLEKAVEHLRVKLTKPTPSGVV